MSDLKDYIDSDDPNYFWRLSSGQHENLLDGAIECIERAEAEIEQLKKDKAELVEALKEAAKYMGYMHMHGRYNPKKADEFRTIANKLANED